MTFPAVLDNVVTDLALDWVGTFSYETVGRIVRESYGGLAERGPGARAIRGERPVGRRPRQRL
jgi:hypothetical protein